MKRIAIIGSGISGLTVAHCLSQQKDAQLEKVEQRQALELTVYESESRIGGHTATIDIDDDGNRQAIDTGFIVYNDWTYPNFIKLIDQLDVESRPTAMSFSVSCEQTGLEYAGSNLNALFAQRGNLLRPAYWNMLRDILRFNKESIIDFEAGKLDAGMSLGEYLKKGAYGRPFVEKYLVPMGAAIWSSGTEGMFEFPALFFVRFFKNHGLLSVKNRPQWRTLVGGSRAYLGPLTENFSQEVIRLNSKIDKINRENDAVFIRHSDGRVETYDAVVFATHSDQALALLENPSPLEKEILGAIPYQANDVVLHTDINLLPKRQLAWSSWNYRLTGDASDAQQAKLTYNMNILQGLQSRKTFCVSLNQSSNIAEEHILGRYNYSHPVFSMQSVAAQQRWVELAGEMNTWYCGAYWRNGFHEDGVASGLNVVGSMDKLLLQDGTIGNAAA